MENGPSPSPDLTKLSLCMIVKDETETLRACLASVVSHVDEVVVAWNGTNPATKAILEEFGCRIVPYTWKDDFADARNFSFAQASHELCFWVDADDTVVHPEKLRELLVAFQDPRVGSVWLAYYYDFDEYGHPAMVLFRERIVRRSWWQWKRRVHEVMLPTRVCSHVKESRVIIRHTVVPERVQQSAARNLRIAQEAYLEEKAKNDVDPVTLYDYARALKAAGQRKEALEIFLQFIDKSEFDDDRYEALHSIADIYRKFRWYDEAVKAESQAVLLRPMRAEAYFGLAETYFCLDEWDRVIWYTELGYKCPEREDNMPMDPIALKARPLLPLQFALFQKAKFSQAISVVQKALEFFPRSTYLQECLKNYQRAKVQEDLERVTLRLYEHLHEHEPEKLEALSKAVPKAASDHPVFVRLMNQFKSPENWRNRLVIYCGPSYELWDPESVKEGVGGSEEAVIYLAPLLAKLGWQVEIYNNCLREGNYDGASWLPFWTYDRSQPCAVFIAWRDARSVLLAPEGSLVYVWLHDRQKPEYWSEAAIARAHKFIFLSQYHRTDLPDLPEEKVFISRNGIRSAKFISSELRDPHRCIYASSPDRGLDILLGLWPGIRAKVPEAELHVFYGFTKTYSELHKDNSSMKEFRDRCLKMLEQPGVVYHGKVGHDEVAKEFLRSAIWTYPTNFTEISCITAMKAQAAGAIPVTSALAALNETVQHGYKISFSILDARTQKSFVQIVADLLLNPEKQEKLRKPMREWALAYFDWKVVAQQWHEEFSCQLNSKPISSPTAALTM
jgi:glycosyltransferase involved in cell wall biosynthesis